ncbi:MAG: hypothetical protein R3C15_10660 [Thermoleophilia bacterium]
MTAAAGIDARNLDALARRALAAAVGLPDPAVRTLAATDQLEASARTMSDRAGRMATVVEGEARLARNSAVRASLAARDFARASRRIAASSDALAERVAELHRTLELFRSGQPIPPASLS